MSETLSIPCDCHATGGTKMYGFNEEDNLETVSLKSKWSTGTVKGKMQTQKW